MSLVSYLPFGSFIIGIAPPDFIKREGERNIEIQGRKVDSTCLVTDESGYKNDNVHIELLSELLSAINTNHIKYNTDKQDVPTIFLVVGIFLVQNYFGEEKKMYTAENYRLNENNKACIGGTVTSYPVFSHEMFGERFYRMDVSVKRESGILDTVPVTVSEKLFDTTRENRGRNVQVSGAVRSHNRHDGEKNRLEIFVFAKEITFAEEGSDAANQVALDGYICKAPVYRKTPLGREIADMLVAVNRPYGKSDYIPCICWGRNARYAGGLEVGAHIQIEGRIQSREYRKKLDDGTQEDRMAYEVSASRLESVKPSEGD